MPLPERRIRIPSGLGRALDFSYPTNIAIAALSGATVAGVLVWTLLSGRALGPAVLVALGTGASVFLGWALGREVDPDYPLSAFLGAAFTLAGLLLLRLLPGFLAVLWFLAAARLVNRSAGARPTWVDSIAILVLGVYLIGWRSWLYGLPALGFFLADALLPPPNRRNLLFGGLAAAAVVVRLAVALPASPGTELTQAAAPLLWWTLGVGTALGLVLVLTSGGSRGTADATGEPLSAVRVRVAQALTLAGALLLGALLGPPGILALLPVWAALAGGGLFRPIAAVAPRQPSGGGG
jgi:hypothetical protein